MKQARIPARGLLVVVVYGVLALSMLGFVTIFHVLSDSSKYSPTDLEVATTTALDLAKILIGAAVGAVTPAAVSAVNAGRNDED